MVPKLPPSRRQTENEDEEPLALEIIFLLKYFSHKYFL